MDRSLRGGVLDTKPTKLQSRAKPKLARAEKLVANARNRVGAVEPVASAPPRR